MEIKGNKVLVLGGAGLVGQAICRSLVTEDVGEIIVASLYANGARTFCEQLKKELGHKCPKLHAEGGNIFVRNKLKDLSKEELLNNQENRHQLICDLLEPLSREILEASTMYHLCNKYKPNVVIDSINTATAISYQNLFGAAKQTFETLKRAVKEAAPADALVGSVEKLLITQYLPQLIRHVQIFLASMVEMKVECYLKIGTCGTGGMGLNIPYTHSEDKPSQMLLAKSSVAGAQSLLLFLMGRTPNAPVIKELKPAAAIAWKRINKGPILRGGRPILMEDCSLSSAVKLEGRLNKVLGGNPFYLMDGSTPKELNAPFIDTGENGVFSLGEFETITDEGQMEFITPEEIAQAAVWEIQGRNTGFDIVAALDNSTMGPTYRAGYMREQALDMLRELVRDHNVDSVAFEILGPPRLSKILYEAYLFKRLYENFERVENEEPEAISAAIFELIKKDTELRSKIISIGIPILLPDGKQLLRADRMAIPSDVPGQANASFEITSASINQWAHDGWVDLRPENMKVWKERFLRIMREIANLDKEGTSSHSAKTSRYWTKADGGTSIEEAKIASWIFINEDKGVRMKA